MVGGTCFRNFSAPRLAAVMIVMSLGPTIPGALLGGERLLYIVMLQVPLYVGAMTAAALRSTGCSSPPCGPSVSTVGGRSTMP
jgi:hypothetical protein